MKHLLRDESGQGMTEYILIVLLIAIAAFVIMQAFGNTISEAFNDAKQTVGNARPD
ncbi:MAG: Flp family type IVb pilin [Elusimicrobiota bacterium]